MNEMKINEKLCLLNGGVGGGLQLTLRVVLNCKVWKCLFPIFLKQDRIHSVVILTVKTLRYCKLLRFQTVLSILIWVNSYLVVYHTTTSLSVFDLNKKRSKLTLFDNYPFV